MTSQAALTEVLNSSELSDAFRLFLESRHCEENLYFWAEVQGFRFSPSTITQEQLNTRAQEIIHKYFDSKSDLLVNVDDLFVKAIKNELVTSGASRSIFDKAMNACLTLLLEDSLPKFFKSHSYLYGKKSYFLFYFYSFFNKIPKGQSQKKNQLKEKNQKRKS